MGSEHHLVLGRTAPLAPAQSARVQGMLWVCKGHHKCAKDAADVQRMLWVCKGCCR